MYPKIDITSKFECVLNVHSIQFRLKYKEFEAS